MKKILLAAMMLIVVHQAISQERGRPLRTEHQAVRMKEALSLTDEQFARVKAVNDEFRAAQSGLLSDTTLTKEQLLAERKEAMDARETAIRKVLTEEQYAKWDSLKKGDTDRVAARRPAQNPVEEMRKALDLSDEQVKEVVKLNADVTGAFRKVSADTAMTRPAMAVAMKKIADERRAGMKKILTEQQFGKFLLYEEEKRSARRRGGRPLGPGPGRGR